MNDRDLEKLRLVLWLTGVRAVLLVVAGAAAGAALTLMAVVTIAGAQ